MICHKMCNNNSLKVENIGLHLKICMEIGFQTKFSTITIFFMKIEMDAHLNFVGYIKLACDT